MRGTGAPEHPDVRRLGDWIEARTAAQHERLERWLAAVDRPVCIEIGAGSHIPTVRRFSENCGGRLIRINPREPEVPAGVGGIGLALGATAAIAALAAALQRQEV
jgi:hypothetical protein